MKVVQIRLVAESYADLEQAIVELNTTYFKRISDLQLPTKPSHKGGWLA